MKALYASVISALIAVGLLFAYTAGLVIAHVPHNSHPAQFGVVALMTYAFFKCGLNFLGVLGVCSMISVLCGFSQWAS